MTTRIVYIALMSGSLIPLDKVTKIEKSKDGCVVSIDGDRRLRCAGRTFEDSLRVLEINDGHGGWTREETEQ